MQLLHATGTVTCYRMLPILYSKAISIIPASFHRGLLITSCDKIKMKRQGVNSCTFPLDIKDYSSSLSSCSHNPHAQTPSVSPAMCHSDKQWWGVTTQRKTINGIQQLYVASNHNLKNSVVSALNTVVLLRCGVFLMSFFFCAKEYKINL